MAREKNAVSININGVSVKMTKKFKDKDIKLESKFGGLKDVVKTLSTAVSNLQVDMTEHEATITTSVVIRCPG